MPTLPEAQIPDSGYIKRLGSSSRQVEAAVDIVNEHGVLVLKKGQPIDKRRVELLLLHKLMRPIEESVLIEEQLTPNQVWQQLQAFIAAYADVSDLHQFWQKLPGLSGLMSELEQHPVVLQKLTLLHEQMPLLFQQSLFTAWFTYGLAVQMGYSAEQQKVALWAGLCHDIGMLHIDPELQHKSVLDAQDWRQIRAHPLISAKLIKCLRGLPIMVAEAVLQHHERYDGSGYPKAMLAEELAPIGQIISCANMLHAMRFGQQHGALPSLALLQSVLQINRGGQFHPEVADAATVALRRGCKGSVSDFSQQNAETSQLRGQVARLQQLAALFEQIQPLIEKLSPSHHPQAKQRVLHHLYVVKLGLNQFLQVFIQAGLKGEPILQWLTQEEDQPVKAELVLMVRELRYNLRRIQRELASLLEAGGFPPTVAEVIENVQGEAESLLGETESSLAATPTDQLN